MADSPFKLFEPYGPGDKEIFFGRDSEIYALYHLLQQTHLVLIYGASGTGKTSLISAGLPKVFKISDWFRVSVRRRDDINISFRHELARLLGASESVQNISSAIQQLFESRWIPVYLVFDQFEEIFILGNDDERRAFFKDLQLLLLSNLPCKIILSMREEYIGHLYDYEPLVPSLFEKRFRVEPMQDGMVQTVILQMCAQYNIELEETDLQKGTAHQILHQLKEGKQAAHLPYIQVYLHYLYLHAIETFQRPRFTIAGIKSIGELGNVLRRFIEAKLEDTQNFLQQQHSAPEGFAQLLLDEFATDEGTRQSRKYLSLVQSLQATEQLVGAALHFLSDNAKLLRADEDDVERYEPLHDAIAKQIHELRTHEDKAFKAFARHIHLSYEHWEKDDRNVERLLPELDLQRLTFYRARLERIEEYPLWENMVNESIRYQRKRRTRSRNLNIFLTVLAIMALLAAGIAFFLNGQAQEARKIAEGNLRRFMRVELERTLLDTETYLKSQDTSYAIIALDSAQQILDKHFSDSLQLQNRIKELKNSIK